MTGIRPGRAGRSQRPPWLLSFLIVVLAAGAILLAFSSPCFAGDIQPPTDEQAEDFIKRVESGEYAFVFGESPDDPPYKVAKTEKVTQIEKHDDGTVFVTYYMYVIYTVSVKTRYDYEEGGYPTDHYYDNALLYSMTWVAGTNQPLEESISAGTDSEQIEVPPDQYGSAMDQAVAAMEASLQKELDSYEHEPGWLAVSSSGEIVDSGEGTAGSGGGKSREGSKIPGPSSWWTWLTGTVIAGIIAAIAGFLNSLLGLPPVPVTPTAPPGKPALPANVPGKEAVKPPQKAPPGATKPHRKTPVDPLAFPPGMEPLPTDIAAGTADPFNTQKYPNQPAYIGDAVHENLTAAKDAAVPTLVDTGVALKDGVVGFIKGVASIPIVALEGFVQIGRLIAVAHTEATEGGPGVFQDMISPSVAWDTLKNIWGSLGKEVLPIEEFKSFFDPHASLEEKLWAIPSAAVKIANLIMMSEKLATRPVPGLPQNFTYIKSAKPGLAAEAALKSTDPAVQKQYEAYKAAGEAKAAGIKETVDKGGKVTQEQVLDAMSDPATMRNIKSAPQAVQKEFNLTQAKEVYKPVYEDVTGFMKGKNPNGEYRVGGVRTPGQKSLINTDNDVIVEELVKTRDGTPYWKEVPAKQWEGAYYDSFAKRTGFDPVKAKARFPEKNWDNMSLKEQHKAWTEGHGQEAMDVKNPEAAHAFSNQPTVMDPKWKPGGKSPVADGRMVDGEGLGHMEGFKTQKGWSGGAINSTTETMEQGCKLCNLSKKLAAQSMKRTGKTITYPEVFKQGEEILNMRNLAPAVRDKALQNLGFRGGYEEFMQKLSGWTGALP